MNYICWKTVGKREDLSQMRDRSFYNVLISYTCVDSIINPSPLVYFSFDLYYNIPTRFPNNMSFDKIDLRKQHKKHLHQIKLYVGR